MKVSQQELKESPKEQNFVPGSAALSADTSGASAWGHRGCATPGPPASPGMAGQGKPSGRVKNPVAPNKQEPGLLSATQEGWEQWDGAAGSFHPTHGTSGDGDRAQPELRDECASSAEGEEPKISPGCRTGHPEPWEG